MQKQTKQQPPNKLYRSTTDIVIAGVAAGIADFFEIDPLIVRILFILLFVFGGSGLVVYLILWIIVPKKGDKSKNTEEIVKKNAAELKAKAQKLVEEIKTTSGNHHKSDRKNKKWFGIMVLALGAMLILRNMGVFYMRDFWPIALIIFGLVILFK